MAKLRNISYQIVKWTLIVIVFFILYFPLIYMVIQSFNSSATGTTLDGFTFKWYGAMFKDPELMEAIVNTIAMALLSTAISVVFGTLAAVGIYALSTKQRKRMMLINNIPVLNADIVTGVFLMLVFQVVAMILPGVNFFGYTTMLIAHIFFSVPYVVLSIMPKFRDLDPNLYDAAIDLGCRPYQALIKVVIPALKTGIIIGGLLAFTMSIDDFVISYMTSGNGVQNFSMWLYSIKTPLKSNAMQKASAYNTIITFLTMAVLIIYSIVLKMRRGKKHEANV